VRTRQKYLITLLYCILSKMHSLIFLTCVVNSFEHWLLAIYK
jgi:hypothetical protein